MAKVRDILSTLGEGKDALDIIRALLATANATDPQKRMEAFVLATAEIASASKSEVADRLASFVFVAASGTNCSHELKDLLEALFK